MTERAIWPAVLVVVILSSLCCFAQQNATGTQPFGSFAGGPEVINLGNLDVSWDIPILHKQGRGLPFIFDLTYDSSLVWMPVTTGSSTAWTPQPGWGWPLTTSSLGYIPSPTEYDITAVCNPQTHTTTTTRYRAYSGYMDIHGTLHHAPNLTTVTFTSTDPNCTGTSTDGLATTDVGTGYTISILHGVTVPTATITTKGGATFTVPIGSGVATLAMDSNGNEITVNASAGKFFDTLDSTNPVLTVTGSSPVNYTYSSPTGSVSVAVSYKNYPVQTHFSCSGVTDYGASAPIHNNLVDKITYPDGSFYQFTYEPTTIGSANVTGRIASVTLPTGGTISYTYTGSNGGINCADGTTMGLSRTTPDSATPWTYSRSTSGSNSWTTTVTDPVSNVTTYNFYQVVSTTTSYLAVMNTNTYYERSRSASGESVLTCYNGNYASCSTTALTLPISQIDKYVTLGSQISASETKVDTSYGGRVTEAKSYDFGVALGSAPSSSLLLKDTTISYAPLAGIIDHPSTVTVKDKTGAIVAQTTINYDETTPAGTTGTPQHGTPTTARGNATTVTSLTSGTATLSKTFTYYDTGTLNTATDVNTAVTTYVYGSGTSCGNSFPTEVDLPLSMTEYATWNCTGGVMLTSKDVNANTTTYKYTDTNYWRLNEVDRPDGGSTTMTYHFGTSSPWYFTQTTAVDSVQSMSIQTNLDGLGRPVKTANLSDPGGYIYQDTVYDSLGRLFSLSNPYHSFSDPTYGVTTYTYDALGRPYVITIPTGNTIQYGYTSRAIKKTEFAGSEDYVTISQIDGLGRTKSVCRLTSVTQANGDAPASCGLDISGTGFNSSYSYDPLGNVTAMCHNAGNCRSFTYDGLSRMLTEKVPEINSITCGGGSYSKCYAYDNVTKGDLSTRTAPKENQSGSATVTTTYTYDQLHRMTEVQYNDGTTPTHWLWYDQSNASAFGWPSTPLPNSKGRLSGTSTLNFTWDAIYGYDSMGRVAVYGTCTIAECQAATPVRFVKNYTYDYAGDLVTGLDNIVGNVTMTPAYNSIGQLKSLSTNCIWINAGGGCASGNVIYNMTYNALGQKIGDTLGSNNIAETWSYNANGQNTGRTSGTQYNYTLTWAPENITSSNDSINGIWNYQYDDFDRLTCAWTFSGCSSSAQRALGWTYDEFGNRWQQNVIAGTGFTDLLSFDAHNHITTSGFAYDAAGNLTNDTFHTYTYDAEGRILKVDGGAYVYNYNSRGLRNSIPAQNSEWLYNIDGSRETQVTTGTGTFISSEFYAGGHVATLQPYVTQNTSATTEFLLSDWLGTVRAWANYNTNNQDLFCTSDPFGEQTNSSCLADSWTGISGLWTDGEDNTLNTPFRNYSVTQGRWLTPDPAGLAAVDPSNPQTWNRYAYVGNNPISFVDPTGLVDINPGMMYAAMGGGGGGFDCTQDGVDQSCATVFSVLAGGGAAACPPGSNCAPEWNGKNWEYFSAFADGTQGYYGMGLAPQVNSIEGAIAKLPGGDPCVYLNDAGTGVESVDQNSSPQECSKTGGQWIPPQPTGTTYGVSNGSAYPIPRACDTGDTIAAAASCVTPSLFVTGVACRVTAGVPPPFNPWVSAACIGGVFGASEYKCMQFWKGNVLNCQ